MKKFNFLSEVPDYKDAGLVFPPITEPLPHARALSMDVYLRFCLDNLRDCADVAATKRRRKRFPAPVQFRLLDNS
jgi:hypothetical protein